ncbi:MAG: DUF6036 family nucleotidyltransferase [Acidobacteriota bacterium]
MRQLAGADRIRRFMRLLGREAPQETRLYFTGGATAVLMGWRSTTIDVDIYFVPDSDPLFRALPRLKESLQINVELASPADFIPELPGWENRSLFIERESKISFYHYDLYAQALAKVERSHSQDLDDVDQMIGRGLIDPWQLREYFESIQPQLYRYPAIDPPSFRKALQDVLS